LASATGMSESGHNPTSRRWSGSHPCPRIANALAGQCTERRPRTQRQGV
jgi:hypothetical protein